MISELMYKILVSNGNKVFDEFKYNTQNAIEVNKNTLLSILKDNEDTEYGRKFNFKDIDSIDKYKCNVPLTSYSDFEIYINRMADGENNILLKDKVEYFGHTSGTTGKQKLIPVTERSRKFAYRYMGMASQSILYDYLKYKWTYGRGVMLTDMVTGSKTKGGIPVSSITSGGMKGMKLIIPYVWTSPLEVMEIEDRQAALYLHILFALREKDLMYIGGPFISNILDFFRVMEEKWISLVRDIREGTIDKNLNIDKKVREKIISYMKPMDKRARELELNFKKGSKEIAKKLWPNIVVVLTTTGGPFKIYDDKVKWYTGNIPIYSSSYCATEASIGINPYLGKTRYVVIPDGAFYEFIKVKGNNNTIRTYTLDELEIGQDYEVVVTTVTGLYRYKMGDVVRVVGYYNNSPELEFLYRKNQLLNMMSEKTTEDHMVSAIRSTANKLDLSIVDYTTRANNSETPGNYIVYMELINNTVPVSKIENILDEELKKANKAYGRFRDYKKLKNIKVISVPRGTFEKIKNILLKNGASKNQLKIPRVINKEEVIKILENK